MSAADDYRVIRLVTSRVEREALERLTDTTALSAVTRLLNALESAGGSPP